ncbi:hypothetical protein [Peristeroidobacter agariperforans]|uniref:hypothetical protein n=1 Tax=Peristeroidobacter agariperforans TaxID=268404 RepID=UPI00101D5842|nr:hypothetical protein [Peristeroidobacter agariperforans]
MNLRKPIDMRSSAPKITFTGSLPNAALIDVSALSCTTCGPLEFGTAADQHFLERRCSTSWPSNGGAFHRSGCVTGIVSYIQYSTTVLSTPSSQFA